MPRRCPRASLYARRRRLLVVLAFIIIPDDRMITRGRVGVEKPRGYGSGVRRSKAPPPSESDTSATASRRRASRHYRGIGVAIYEIRYTKARTERGNASASRAEKFRNLRELCDAISIVVKDPRAGFFFSPSRARKLRSPARPKRRDFHFS